MMKDMLTSITNRLGADPQVPKWNCGGSKFTECIGCGAQVPLIFFSKYLILDWQKMVKRNLCNMQSSKGFVS